MTTAHTAPHRTFDCPWCGAINLVEPSQIGQHWKCPECKKETKLTTSNTSDRPPTAPPPDAPHLSGDRTFDCPWCGAISSVPSSHLGERFACPECRRETKLTSTNARRAPVTAPPPDAPPAAPPPASGAWIAIAIVAVLAGIGLWMAFSSGSDSTGKETTGKDASSTADGDPPPPTVNPNAKSSSGPPPMPMPPPREDTDAPMPPAPPDPPLPTPPPPTPGPDSPEAKPPPAPEKTERIEKARADAAVALAALLEKSRAREDAFAALGKWMESNPEYTAAAAERVALGEVKAEGKRLLDAKELVPDPAAPTPTGVRAYNAAIAAYVEANPQRVRAIEAVIVRMKADASTAAEVTDRAWKEVNFFGPGFGRTLAASLEARTQELATMIPPELSKGLADTSAQETAAKKAAEEADAALERLLSDK